MDAKKLCQSHNSNGRATQLNVINFNMVNKFFTCPYCQKETSYWLEPASNSVIFSSYTVGFGYLVKKKCDVCKKPLSINWFQYFLSYIVLFLFLVFLWVTCKSIYYGFSDDLKQVAPLIGFFLFIPAGIVFLYLIFPSLVGLVGLRLYSKRDEGNKETELEINSNNNL